MNILAEKDPDYCGSHSLEHNGVNVQLVMIDHCSECNPTRSDFIGMETEEVIGEAVVMDRPDLSPFTYEVTMRMALEKMYSPESIEDTELVKRVAKSMSAELLDIASRYEPGAVVVRAFGEYDIWWHKKAG